MNRETSIPILAAAWFLSAWELSALANRVFVSARAGSDANACDNIATPCQTFTGAVAEVNPGGEVIVLETGGYGPVTLTHAVTIEAPPGVLAFVHPPSGDAVTVNAGASDAVVLRGLILNRGTGNGIQVNTVGSLVVEDCSITGFFGNGISVASAGALSMKGTDVAGCGFGVAIANPTGHVTASIDHCQLDGNNNGFVALPPSPGTATVTITNSTANANLQRGWYGGGSGGSVALNLEYCAGSENGTEGLVGHSNSAVRYSHCVFSNNGAFGVRQFSTGVVESRTDNSITGNTMGATSGVIGSYPAQ